MKKLTFAYIFLLVLPGFFSTAQKQFNGRLISKTDSSVVAFANVRMTLYGINTKTDQHGNFTFPISDSTTIISLEIKSGGVFSRVNHIITGPKPEMIYIDLQSTELDPVDIKGYSAKEVVAKALIGIPENYIDSSYFSHSFYRQYQKINDKFENLSEANVFVLFALESGKNFITSSEVFAIQQMRRSNWINPIHNQKENGLPEFMKCNPVYHLDRIFIHPKELNLYTYTFDTATNSTCYVINYVNYNFSTEDHGIENFDDANFKGEAVETGKLIVDRETFAFISIERKAVRNKKYDYPRHNNFVWPALKYTEEFKDGSLKAVYEKIGNKWFLKKLFRMYTNEFFKTQVYTLDYIITECFEWHQDSISRSLPKNCPDVFYSEPRLETEPYVYDASWWERPFPEFYFFDQKKVHADLERKTPLANQFPLNGKE
jgi:hypothetical protein